MAAAAVSDTSSSPDHAAEQAPDHSAEVAALRAERDALERRAVEAETMAEQLADALADAQRRLAEQPGDADEAQHLTLFDNATPAEPGTKFAPDGSDQGVLPIALAATAVVALLVALVTVVAGSTGFITLLALVASGALAWAAYQTRVTRVFVEVVDGVVKVTEGDSTRSFDLNNDHIKVDVQGKPGDEYWRVRFYRRALDPVDVDATMVDPATFLAQVRHYRPEV